MTFETDYNKYEMPEPFEISERNQWGYILNDMFEQIDDDIIARGTLSERPGASTEGRLWLVEDSGQLYYDTSSQWDRLGMQATVKDSGGTILIGPTTLDFDSHIDVTNPSSGTVEINISDDFVLNSGDEMTGTLDMSADIVSGGQTIWDESSGWIDQTALENDSVTLTGGTGISGGTVSLGGSTSISIDEADNLTWTGSHDFTGGTITVPSPSVDSQAATKGYVDATTEGLDLKESVKAATDGSNVDLTSATDPNPIDGYTLNDGERVLLKDQTTASENGIYIATTATDPTTWTRSADFDEDSEVNSGAFTFVENGTNNANEGWILTTADPITVGTTDLSFTQFSGAGQITAGDGLGKSGDSLFVNTSLGLEIVSDNVRLDEDYGATWTTDQTFSADVLDGSANIIYDQSNNYIPASRVEQGSGSGLNADQVDGFEAADLRNSKNVAQFTSTDTTTDINQSSWTDVEWDTQLTLDSAYTHDATNSPETVTFDETGTYYIEVSVSYDVGSADINVGVKFNKNGTRIDTFGQTGATSNANSNTSGSTTIHRLIDMSAGDTLKVQTIEQGNTGTATMRADESILTVNQLSSSAAPITDADTLDGLDSTAFVKTDGSSAMSGTLGVQLSEPADFTKFTNTTTSDELRISTESDGTFDLDVYDSSATTLREGLSFEPSTGNATFANHVTLTGGADVDNTLTINAGATVTSSNLSISDGYLLASGDLQDLVRLEHSATSDRAYFRASSSDTIDFSVWDDSALTSRDIWRVDPSVGEFKVQSPLNMEGSDSILDAGTAALSFDGSGNVTVPNTLTASSTIVANATLALDMSSGSKFALPSVTSDPSASAGEMWYRSDLD